MPWTEWQGYEAHMLPGRLRVLVPGLCGNFVWARRLSETIAQIPGVRYAHANSASGRVLVVFDPAAGALERIGRHLGGMVPRLRRPTGVESISAGAISLTAEAAQATSRVTVTGVALAAAALKRVILGPSALARSWGAYGLAGVVTAVASYPYLRHELRVTAAERRLDDELLVGVASLAALLLRENLLGLGILFLTSLAQRALLHTRVYDRLGRAGCQQGRAGLIPDLFSAEGFRQDASALNGWAAAVGLGAGVVARDWRQGLAALVAAAPVWSPIPHEFYGAEAPARVRRSALQAVRRNQVLSSGLNVAGLALVATGAVDPMGASVWRDLTSLAILCNSSQLIPLVRNVRNG